MQCYTFFVIKLIVLCEMQSFGKEKKMIKAAFFDIDGTLVNSENELAPSARRALEQLNDKGVMLVVATGRFPSECREFFRSHPGLPFHSAICANGAVLMQGDKIIRDHSLPRETIKDFLQLARDNDIPYWTGNVTGNYYSLKDLARLADVLHASELERKDHYNPDYHLHQDVYGGELFCSGEELRLFDPYRDIIDIASAMFIGGATAPMYDFWQKGIDKGVGVNDFCDVFGVLKEETLAAGDSHNDLPAFRNVGLSIAMGNADENIRECADFVTKDINEDGLAYALKKLGLID